MRSLAIILVLAGAVRFATGYDPGMAATLVAGLAVAGVVYGMSSGRRSPRRSWRLARLGIGLGLLCQAASVVAQVEGLGGPPTQFGTPMVLSTVGAVLAIAGLTSLIRQRLPERATEALAEAFVATMALAFVVLALVLVPAQGWRPAHELPAIGAPLLDVIVLWLACSLVSLTERHPASYGYFIGGFACLFFANAVSAALMLSGGTHHTTSVETVVLWGTCFWGLSLVHPSRQRSFDPVPLRSMRPSGVKVAMLVAVALVVPGVLSVQSALGISSREPGLIIGSTLLPLLMLLYLLHQVFTHAAAEYRAQHDPLTGVCNRLLFEDRLRQCLAQAERTVEPVAVMFLDLDRFKGINDSLGHAVGNQLLQAVVKRLQGCLRDQDTLARFGGDEFTLIIPNTGRHDDATAQVAERLLDRFADPFNVGGRQLTVKASVGIAVYPDDGLDAETLLKHADTAMYQAKAAGRNTYELFDTAMSARARLRFALEDSLRAAVECGRLAVHYQPKLDMATGTIAGVEALARWQHPQLGFIPPWAFIPLAEETSLVATLGEWVLDVACTQAKRWQDDGLASLPVAVNLSPRQFAHQPVVEMVAAVLKRTGLDPRLLELEVTESVLMEHMGAVAACLNELRAMGVRCSIDDFGTGYNALTYLAEMPIDAIKIDRSFVQKIEDDGGGSPIVGAVIALAHSLDLQVIAEGVETDAQLQFLEAHRCDQVQGFRFSPPVSAEELTTLMRNPERVFTDWRQVIAAPPPPISVVSPARFEALLDSILQEGHWPTELDVEAIDAVLAALQPDVLAKVRDARFLRPLSARLAVGTLAGLASVSGGLTAAGALPRSVQAPAAEILDQGTGLGLPTGPDGPASRHAPDGAHGNGAADPGHTASPADPG